MRLWHLLRFLSQRIHITAIVPYTMDEKAYITHLWENGIDVIGIPLKTRKRSYIAHFRGLFSSWPYTLSSPLRQMKSEVVHRSHSFRWIHFEFQATAFAGFHPTLKGKRWITLHFPACHAYQEQFKHEPGLTRKLYLKTQIPKICYWEKRILKEFEHVVVTSSKDFQIFSGKTSGHIHMIPNGVDCDGIPFVKNLNEDPVVTITTNFKTPQNVEGTWWFVQEVWPKIKQQIPQAKLVIAGAGAPENLLKVFHQHAEISYLGWIDHLDEVLIKTRVFVIPLLYGTGTKLRFLTGLAAGLPVVTTPAGAWGLESLAPDITAVVPDAEDFARAVVRFLEKPPASEQRRKGREAAAAYCWKRLADRLLELYETYA